MVISLKFKTEVIDIIERAKNVKSFQFFKPKTFEYDAGQFMVITIQSGDEELEKHFTISSSPTEDFIEITKKMTGHKFSNALNSLKKGDIIKADGPHGKFVINESDEKIAMLSGGIGITPIRSICKYATDKQLAIYIILIYGNETKSDIVFKKDFEKMKKSNKKLTVVHVLNQPNSSWKPKLLRV